MEIDSLIVSLRLDPRQFNQAQKESLEQIRKFEVEAKKAGAGVENSAQKMTDGFSRVTKELLGLGLALAGANGLKDLVIGTVQSADAIGKQARALDVAAGAWSAYANAAERAGMNVGEAASGFKNMFEAVAGVRAHVPGSLERLGQQYILPIVGPNADFYDAPHLIQQLFEGLQKLPKDSGLRSEFARHVASGPAILAMAQQFKGQDLNKVLAESVTITEEQAEAARNLTTSMVDLKQAIERQLNKLLPGTEQAVKDAQEFATGKGPLPFPGPTSWEGFKTMMRNAITTMGESDPQAMPPPGPAAYGSGIGFHRLGRQHRWSNPFPDEPPPQLLDVDNMRPHRRRGGKEGDRFEQHSSTDNSKSVHIGQVTVVAPAGSSPEQFAQRFAAAVQASIGPA